MAESNKTEKASPKKRRDERKKGNVFQSRDVSSILVLLAGFFIIARLGGFAAQQMEHLYAFQLGQMVQVKVLSESVSRAILLRAAFFYFITALPLMLALMTVGVLAGGVQTRFMVSGDLIKFKAERLNPLQGLKKLFSLKSFAQLLLSLMKVAVVLWMVIKGIQGALPVTPDLLATDLGHSIDYLKESTLAMAYRICLFFVIVVVLDFGYQKFDYEQKLRMTKQEVKDEYKQTEGDPFIKSRIREKQRKISLNRMIQQVPSADVVVRNPTHFAVALQYDMNSDAAPRVLAKGRDYAAARILQVAQQSGVPVRENVPLARSLYKDVDVGDFIPEALYKAVAEVLAWVYAQREKGEGHGRH